MAFVRACAVGELPPGAVLQVEVGGQRVALCNHGGALRALGGTCPHVGGPLGEGHLDESGALRCPWHGWGFDPGSGKCLNIPRAAVPVYAVKVEGDDVLVEDTPQA